MPVHNVQCPSVEGISPQIVLSTTGVLITAEIAVPSTIAQFLNEKGMALPQPVTGKALLDTGASKTCVDETILKSLKLPQVGFSNVHTPSGTARQFAYPVKLEFPGSPIPPLEFNSVLGATLKNQGIDVLIGRDILCQCVFIVNGPAGNFTIAF